MGLFSSGPDLNDVIFQLRMSSKQLEREAKRAEKEEKGLFIIVYQLTMYRSTFRLNEFKRSAGHMI